MKRKVTRGPKGGKPGRWSARKAQLAAHEYKAEGGQYKGDKQADNHLSQWTREDRGTRSGKASGATGERYLPKRVRETVSEGEYRRTTAKKRADSAKGRQFSSQPADVAKKAASVRKAGEGTRAALMEAAARQQIKGRSRMNKAELQRALAGGG